MARLALLGAALLVAAALLAVGTAAAAPGPARWVNPDPSRSHDGGEYYYAHRGEGGDYGVRRGYYPIKGGDDGYGYERHDEDDEESYYSRSHYGDKDYHHPHKKCHCPHGQVACHDPDKGLQCVDPTTNALFCGPPGSCGSPCPTGYQCLGGQCKLCSPLLTECTNPSGAKECVDVKTNFDNCGACGKGCPENSNCINGACVCDTPYTLCDGQCVDTSSNDNYCGNCTNACTGGLVCENSVCTADTCLPPTPTLCNGQCVNLNEDNANCGACSKTCTSPSTCTDGECCGIPRVEGGCQGGKPCCGNLECQGSFCCIPLNTPGWDCNNFGSGAQKGCCPTLKCQANGLCTR